VANVDVVFQNVVGPVSYFVAQPQNESSLAGVNQGRSD